MEDTTLLSQAIHTLALRQEIVKIAEAMGYTNLQAIINESHTIMSAKADFSYRWFFEIYDFLEKHGLENSQYHINSPLRLE